MWIWTILTETEIGFCPMIKAPVGLPVSHVGMPKLDAWLCFSLKLPSSANWESSSDGSSDWLLTIHVGSLGWVPDAQLQPQSSPGHCKPWRNESVDGSIPLSFCLSFPPYQTHFFFNIRGKKWNWKPKKRLWNLKLDLGGKKSIQLINI